MDFTSLEFDFYTNFYEPFFIRLQQQELSGKKRKRRRKKRKEKGMSRRDDVVGAVEYE